MPVDEVWAAQAAARAAMKRGEPLAAFPHPAPVRTIPVLRLSLARRLWLNITDRFKKKVY